MTFDLFSACQNSVRVAETFEEFVELVSDYMSDDCEENWQGLTESQRQEVAQWWNENGNGF